jgi:septal ring factor EnvC (AmiA/AmiB activator)
MMSSASRSLARLTFKSRYVHVNSMRAARLQDALERLTTAIRDVESELAAMKAEHDPLASHIFVSRRQYRTVNDTKSGKRREIAARLQAALCCSGCPFFPIFDVTYVPVTVSYWISEA